MPQVSEEQRANARRVTGFTDEQVRLCMHRCNFLTRVGSVPTVCTNMPDFFLGFKGELGGQRQSGVFYCASHAYMIIDYVKSGSGDRPLRLLVRMCLDCSS